MFNFTKKLALVASNGTYDQINDPFAQQLDSGNLGANTMKLTNIVDASEKAQYVSNQLRGFYGFSQVQKIHDCTHAQMKKAIVDIDLQIQEDGAENYLVFVYYAGYALVDEKGYTQPILGNAETKNQLRSYQLQQYLNLLATNQNVEVICIFDCHRIQDLTLESSQGAQTNEVSKHAFLFTSPIVDNKGIQQMPAFNSQVNLFFESLDSQLGDEVYLRDGFTSFHVDITAEFQDVKIKRTQPEENQNLQEQLGGVSGQVQNNNGLGLIKFHVEINQDYRTSCFAMKNWIGSSSLTKGQLISLNSCLEDLKNERHMLVCFYRDRSLIEDQQQETLDLIQFKNFNTSQDWDSLCDDAEKFSKKTQMLSVNQLNIMEQNLQTAWYQKSNQSTQERAQTHMKGFFCQDGTFRKVIDQSIEWMDRHLLPQQLMSISMTQTGEDINGDGAADILLCIAHTAGEKPLAISNRSPGFFKLMTMTANDQIPMSILFQQAVDYLNGLDSNTDFYIVPTNLSCSVAEQKVLVIITWEKRSQENSIIFDQPRNDTCCCSIF